MEAVPGDRGGKVATIGALDLKGIRTGLSVPGAIDGDTRAFFVAELLAPPANAGTWSCSITVRFIRKTTLRR